jgi:hypothetical protein
MKRDTVALAGVLAATLILRAGNLGLIHDRGDQMIWAALACHAARDGLPGYTLRNVDDGIAPLTSDLAYRGFMIGPRETGTLLAGLKQAGEGYWDAPLANQPPAFTLVLVASHALLGAPRDGFPLLGRGPRGVPLSQEEEERIARRAARSPPPGAVRAQLWATLPVLLSELGTVALVFLLARRLGGTTAAALCAASLYAFDPLALYAAHRLLSNPTLATATVGAVLAFLAAEKDPRLATLAGALAGLACLVKVSAIFLLPAGWRRPRYWIVAFFVLAPWSLLEWRLLGNPLGLAWENQKDWLQVSEWGRVVTSRSLLYYLGVLAHSPLLLVGLGTALAWLVPRRGATHADRTRELIGGFVLLVLLAAELHSGGKEGRHLLHVFPLLAVAASVWFEPACRMVGKPVVVVGLAVVLYAQALYGLGFAFDTGRLPP